jgi:hypothetical protein
MEVRQRHLPPGDPRCVIAQIQHLIPATTAVTVRGDGDFDGTEFQAAVRALHRPSICRTAPNLRMTLSGKTRPIGALAPTRAELLTVPPAWSTAEEDGPVRLLVIGEAAAAQPTSLVRTMADLDVALAT